MKKQEIVRTDIGVFIENFFKWFIGTIVIGYALYWFLSTFRILG